MEFDANEIIKAYAQEVANLTTRAIIAEARAAQAEAKVTELTSDHKEDGGPAA